MTGQRDPDWPGVRPAVVAVLVVCLALVVILGLALP